MSDENSSTFSFVLQVLADLQAQFITQLRSPATQQAALQKKLEVDRAIDILSLASRHGLSRAEVVCVMPECGTPTPSSEYRVIDDNESDRCEHWTEVVIDGNRLRLQPGDVVLRRP